MPRSFVAVGRVTLLSASIGESRAMGAGGRFARGFAAGRTGEAAGSRAGLARGESRTRPASSAHCLRFVGGSPA